MRCEDLKVMRLVMHLVWNSPCQHWLGPDWRVPAVSGQQLASAGKDRCKKQRWVILWAPHLAMSSCMTLDHICNCVVLFNTCPTKQTCDELGNKTPKNQSDCACPCHNSFLGGTICSKQMQQPNLECAYQPGIAHWQ